MAILDGRKFINVNKMYDGGDEGHTRGCPDYFIDQLQQVIDDGDLSELEVESALGEMVALSKFGDNETLVLNYCSSVSEDDIKNSIPSARILAKIKDELDLQSIAEEYVAYAEASEVALKIYSVEKLNEGVPFVISSQEELTSLLDDNGAHSEKQVDAANNFAIKAMKEILESLSTQEIIDFTTMHVGHNDSKMRGYLAEYMALTQRYESSLGEISTSDYIGPDEAADISKFIESCKASWDMFSSEDLESILRGSVPQ